MVVWVAFPLLVGMVLLAVRAMHLQFLGFQQLVVVPDGVQHLIRPQTGRMEPGVGVVGVEQLLAVTNLPI